MNTKDRPARTLAARQGRWQRYIDKAREIHPEATDEFIADIAERLRTIDMRKMALKSARSRRRRLAEKVAEVADDA